jgi:arylsulfatase A-like enzyme
MSEPKNIVLVTVDALRYDRVGRLRDGVDLTPRISALAERGVVFDSLFTQAVETPIAHAALFSGCYPMIRGAHALFGRKHVPPRRVLLAEWLRAQGYQTGGFISAYALDRNRGFGKGFDVYGDKLRQRDPFYPLHRGHALILMEALKRLPVPFLKRTDLAKRRYGEDTLAEATRWLEATTDEHPFFLFCHLFDAHCEYYSPTGFRSSPVRTDKATLRRFETGKRELTPNDRAQIEEQYDLSVSHVDMLVGRLEDALRARAGCRDTVIVVTADHGEGLGDHGYMLHGCELYDEEIHVPGVIASLRGDLPPHSVRQLVRIVDLAPTVLRIAGLPTFECDGRDATELIGHAEAPDERVSFTETRHTYLKGSWLRAVRSATHKYIYDASGRRELYALADDHDEMRNMIGCGDREAAELIRWMRAEVGI